MSMQADVTHFERFYQSPLGQMVRDEICRTFKTSPYPNPKNLYVGIGYAQPFIDRYSPAICPRLALMPAAIGALQHSTTPQSLCLPHLLPLCDSSVHGIVMAHALELTEHPKQSLREAWRVLHDDGELQMIVPYRRGFWARSAEQPFGLGTPYTRRQLRSLLNSNGFAVEKMHRLLDFPPIQHPQWQKFLPIIAGAFRLFGLPAGILLVRATKAQLNPSNIGKASTIADLSAFVRKPRLSGRASREKLRD